MISTGYRQALEPAGSKPIMANNLASRTRKDRWAKPQRSNLPLTQQNLCYFVAFALVSIISRLLTANLRSPPARPGLCVNKIMVLCRLCSCPPFCDIAISCYTMPPGLSTNLYALQSCITLAIYVKILSIHFDPLTICLPLLNFIIHFIQLRPLL